MQTIQFVLALTIGWFLAAHDLSLPWIAFWTIAASAILTLSTLVVQHWSIPPASRSRRGLTIFQGQLGWLFFGTITAIVVALVAVVLIRQRLG
jgi:hypothetical protein